MSDPARTLLETVRVRQGVAPLWPLHVARLTRSAQALGIELPFSVEPPSGGEDRAVRLAVGPVGLAVASRAVGPVVPLRLMTAVQLHPGYPHKTEARGAFDMARAAAIADGADDAVLLTADGVITEAAIWALGWWAPDALVFPAMSLGVLPSVGRARLGAMTAVREGHCALADAPHRAWIAVNAVRGVVAVGQLDHHRLPADERTARLQADFWPAA